MTRTTQFLRISIVFAVAVAVTQAHAWGPRAQRTITGMSIQVIQGKYPGTFRPGDSLGRFTPGQTSYEQDVLKGAEAGWGVIARDIPINSNEEAILAVASQINLLSEVRPYGAGSYFAYRLGALSALISDIVLPFGLAWTPEQEQLQEKIEADIERHLSNYGYTSHETRRLMINNVTEYFRTRQHFFRDNMLLIKDDYNRGRGYDGLLKESSKAHFESAIEAVSDAWHTILESGASHSPGGGNANLLAQYFVDEIAYQLNEKENFHQAGEVYENLAMLNSTNPKIYEEVGDLFYAFDTQRSAERSVREWRIAYELGGQNREAVARKISDHFLREGRQYLEEAGEKGKGETELPAALVAFKKSLQYNRTSQTAADLIQDTNMRIAERNEHRETIINIIATAQSTQEEADNLAAAGNYGNAIPSYRQANEILAAVDDEFVDQAEIAAGLKQDIEKSVSTAIANVLELASAAIEEGERLEDQHKYDEAAKSYARIPVLVQVIPDDHNSITLQDKQDVLALAQQKIDEVRVTKSRWEASQAGAPGGAPAAPGNNRATGGLNVPTPPPASAPAPAGNADSNGDDGNPRKNR